MVPVDAPAPLRVTVVDELVGLLMTIPLPPTVKSQAYKYPPAPPEGVAVAAPVVVGQLIPNPKIEAGETITDKGMEASPCCAAFAKGVIPALTA